jgi:hypothetical protein
MNLDLVVSAYGLSPHLGSCLRSLFEQDAVRDGLATITIATSTPSKELEAAARCYGARYMVNPVRRCIGADWNFALSTAQAPLVAICHQDDTYHPEFASRMLETFSLAPSLLMASSSYRKLDGEGREQRSAVLQVKRLLMWRAFGPQALRWGPTIRRRMLSWGNPVCCSSVVLNRQELDDFCFDVEMQSNLDWDAWERIAARPGLIAYLPEALVSHRVHGGSATSRLIANSARPVEDLLMLSRFWPTAFARAWLTVYSQAYRSHRGAARREADLRRLKGAPTPTGAPATGETASVLQLHSAGKAD